MVYLGDVHPIVSFIRKTGTSLTTITEDQDHRQFQCIPTSCVEISRYLPDTYPAHLTVVVTYLSTSINPGSPTTDFFYGFQTNIRGLSSAKRN